MKKMSRDTYVVSYVSSRRSMIIAGKMFRWPQNQRPVLTGTGQKLVVGTQANIQHTISMTFQTCQ